MYPPYATRTTTLTNNSFRGVNGRGSTLVLFNFSHSWLNRFREHVDSCFGPLITPSPFLKLFPSSGWSRRPMCCWNYSLIPILGWTAVFLFLSLVFEHIHSHLWLPGMKRKRSKFDQPRTVDGIALPRIIPSISYIQTRGAHTKSLVDVALAFTPRPRMVMVSPYHTPNWRSHEYIGPNLGPVVAPMFAVSVVRSLGGIFKAHSTSPYIDFVQWRSLKKMDLFSQYES